MATSARDQRLDQLVQLTTSWADSTQKVVTSRVVQLQRMLKGRGAGEVAQTSVASASQLVVDEVDAFLLG